LPEAIGPCGVTFPNGDAEALARVLRQLLGDPDKMRALRNGAEKHLAQFTKAEVAAKYLKAMGAA
jgi:glycosyltransferase involved in cell wall biosynthesis